jgi:hypothetical protein
MRKRLRSVDVPLFMLLIPLCVFCGDDLTTVLVVVKNSSFSCFVFPVPNWDVGGLFSQSGIGAGPRQRPGLSLNQGKREIQCRGGQKKPGIYNVMYQKTFLIRLIIVSPFLSHYIRMIYQPASWW